MAFDAAGGDAFMVHLGQTGPSYAVAFLGVFAVFAMWMFPEVTKKNPASLKQGDRQEKT